VSLLRHIASGMRALLRKKQVDAELDQEVRTYLEMATADQVRQGKNLGEAKRVVRLEQGGPDSAKETVGAAGWESFVETVWQDLRFAIRTLRKAPGFTAVAVLTLALGIGANAAIFSVVNAVLLRPLAYKDPGQLVTILMNGYGPVSVANYIDWREQSQSFEVMGAADYWSPNLTGVDSPEHIRGLKVTQNLFPMLGIQPLLGRLFVEGEDQSGSEHEVILSYRFWQRRFSGDGAVLGKTILLDGNAYVVVGVMPEGFQFAPFWATHAELWVPNAFGERVHNRGGNSLRIFARLRPGVALKQARSEMATINAHLELQYPGTNRDVVVTPLKEKVVGEIETPLLLLLGAVGFVLLITCANVAHMLMARAAVRQKEIAVRAALGAGRLRVIRQFLTESILLGLFGGAVGLLLNILGSRALIALSPPDIPRLETVTVDGRVGVFLFAVTLLTSVGFGLVPALQSRTVNLNENLKEGGRSGSEGIRRNGLRSFLVASEIGLALVLLIGAGLMIRSFFSLQRVDPGFNPRQVLSMVVSVAGSKEADPGRRRIFYEQLLERVRSLWGVQAAGGINHLPLGGDLWGWPFVIESRPTPRPGESPSAVYRMVTPGYFQTMQLPLVQGRDIATSDNVTAPGVVIINEQAVREYWPATNPIGQRISFDSDKSNPTWLTVIGVAKDAKQDDWTAKPGPEVYLAAFQNHDFLGDSGSEVVSHVSYITLVVRAAENPAGLTSAVRETVWAFDRNLPISEVVTMDEVVAAANARPRFEMLLLSVFAAVALVLATVGIYGVMSYSVSRRSHEIGVRMSLGARGRDVLLMVVRQGMLLALSGSLAGLIAALLLSRLMAKLLYGVKPTDPLTFAGVAVALGVVALLACYIPARRATRVNPVVALRYE